MSFGFTDELQPFSLHEEGESMREIDLDAERDFENRKAVGENVRGAQSKYYWATGASISRHKQLTCETIRKKSVLEIGCASGCDAVEYVQFARRYVGLDISDEAIKNCESLELENAQFTCVDGHVLPFDDNSFDCVIVNSLLHHLDLEKSFSEICRVLTEGGVLLFREPLGTNPLFQVYRFLTPSARTDDERPFTFKDLALMRSLFEFEDVQWFGFLSLFSAFTKSEGVRSFLTSVDGVLSRTPLKFLFWQFSGVARVK
jgi:SAM-dependent methyltransferase